MPGRRTLAREALNQLLHALAGGLLVFLMGNPWLGLGISLAVAGAREAAQHGWGALDSRRRGMWVDLGFWLAGALGTALLLPGWAAASEAVAWPAGTPRGTAISQTVPVGATALRVCAVYEDTSLLLDCIDVPTVPGNPTPAFDVEALARDGYHYNVELQWVGVPSETVLFDTHWIDTLPEDLNQDGYVGGPDWVEVILSLGDDVFP